MCEALALTNQFPGVMLLVLGTKEREKTKELQITSHVMPFLNNVES